MKKLVALVAVGGLFLTVGCHVSVDKNGDGKDKNVKIDTPLGGLHVRSDNTVAADIGLPAYPGANVAPDHDGDKSADVHIGFGDFQIRVKVVNYQTTDPQDKVLDYYQKAMGRYGDVIRCQGSQAVGTATSTKEGLTCSEDHGSPHFQVSGHDDWGGGLTLRAGSRHHQHIVAIKNSSGPGTRFALVELELPSAIDNDSSKTSN